MKEDAYITIGNTGEGFFRNKGSRFISFAIPVKNEEEINFHLQSIRQKFPDAHHHCYAWSLGIHRNKFRYYDDGEPSGTAGRPIYGQILSTGITNVLVVVVRYFGGVKLGPSGLIEAYKTAALEAINKAEKITEYEMENLDIEFDYSMMEVIMRKIKWKKFRVVESTYGERCVIRIEVRKSLYDEAVMVFKDISGIILK